MKFIYNAPAILHKGAIIVGDTHFGMEGKLRTRGIYNERFSLGLFIRLKELIEINNAKRIIFLGDVKEEIRALDRTTIQILNSIADICKITIVRGNHDGGIEHFQRAEIIPSEGFVYEGLGFLHGHSWPAQELMDAQYIVMGHQHPLVTITDGFGKKHSQPTWLVAPPDQEKILMRYKKFNKKIKLIMMPAFNPLVGSIINYDEKERFGPLLNNKLFKLDRALVFRLDGTCLGKLSEIH